MSKPVTLPPALLSIADRIGTILMTLVDAIAPIATSASTETLSSHAARVLFFRLTRVVTTIVRLCAFGVTPARTATPKDRPAPAPTTQRPSPAPTLPRRPGWLLAALPDIAPAAAADLAALLADPALESLLAAAPALHRALCPLLRGLGVTPPQPSPSAPSPGDTPPPPRQPTSCRRAHPAQPPCPATPPSSNSTRSANHLDTPFSLRYRNASRGAPPASSPASAPQP